MKQLLNSFNQPWDRLRHPEKYAEEPVRATFTCSICGAVFTGDPGRSAIIEAERDAHVRTEHPVSSEEDAERLLAASGDRPREEGG